MFYVNNRTSIMPVHNVGPGKTVAEITKSGTKDPVRIGKHSLTDLLGVMITIKVQTFVLEQTIPITIAISITPYMLTIYPRPLQNRI